MLYHIVRDTRRALYCGPTAFCAVTGATASEALALFDNLRPARSDGRPAGVRGVSHPEMVQVFHEFGWRVRWHTLPDAYPTLAEFCRNKPETCIVNVRGHYLAVDDTHVCDTITKQPVPHKEGPSRRARVLSYMERVD